ncbi:TlpA disulfide reductase family protein [Colwellia sp. 12G3]|uniref:TlpA disulfide reductase family protein n=1 Tax=Colwellia sp. 12G3 TaxID=2058299 RepID=UPI000C3284FD|nr:TlpA disulfide reductase family protein [Colwellia sp. 12G3]PKI17897.1 thioredoxin [Colwellia sp. 12G3]
MKKTLVFALLLLSFTASALPADQFDSPRKSLEQALLAQEGKVVYIDFWASWCGPCVKSFPWMNKIQQQYKEQGFTVISINLDADETKASQFLKDNPALFAVIYDHKGTIAKHFSIQGMPTSMLISRDGEIKFRHSGFFTGKMNQYEDEIKQLLNSSSTTLSKKTNRGNHESE